MVKNDLSSSQVVVQRFLEKLSIRRDREPQTRVISQRGPQARVKKKKPQTRLSLEKPHKEVSWTSSEEETWEEDGMSLLRISHP